MVQISRKMKITIAVFIGLLITGILTAYQKIFGGKPQKLPQNNFVVGNNSDLKTASEEQKESVVSVYYSENIAKGIQTVIEKTGNLDFIKPGQKVLVKPNVNSNDPAPGTTHPQAVAEVVRLAKAKGAYVIVGDRSNPAWKTIPAMKETGIYDAVKNAGADEIVGFEDEEWIRVSPENAKDWPNGFRIPKRLSQIDHIISVPVLHTHSITGYSLGIKNFVGLIHPADRMLFHSSKNIYKMIAEISLAIKPSLVVIDGTKSFITGGPSSGTMKESKVYIASQDTLSADAAGFVLLKKEGAKFNWTDPFESDLIKNYFDLNLSLHSKSKIESTIENI